MKRAEHHRSALRVVLLMVAAVVAGAGIPTPAWAAIFTSAASGNYSSNATWGGASNPANGTADTATVGAHTVTVTTAADPALDTINLNDNAASLQFLIDGPGSNGTIAVGSTTGATLSAGSYAAAITVGNNGGGNTGNTIALGALTWNLANTGLTFNANNGYKLSFTSWQAMRYATENRFTITDGAEVIVGSLTNVPSSVNNKFTKYGNGVLTITNSSISNGASAMNLTIDVSAGSVDFSNGLDQTGANAVSFTKTGAGGVRLLGASSYAGNSSLDGGTVQLGAAGALSNGALTMRTVTLDVRNVPQSYSGAVSLAGSGGSTLTIAGDQALTLSNVNTFVADANDRIISVTDTGLVTFGYTSGGLVAGINLDTGNAQSRTHILDIAANSYLLITAPLLKSGPTNNTVVIKQGAGVMEWQGANSYGSAASTELKAGTLLLTGAGVVPNNLLLTGGVLAQGVDFTRGLGTSATTFRFGAGGGGFAAYGAPVSVMPGNATWGTGGTANFLPNNAPLILGSSIADDVVTYTSDINLKTGAAGTDSLLREIRVLDNANSATDKAVISGTLTNTTAGFGISKTGSGTLELTGTNSYSGATSISEGILRVNGSHSGGGLYTVAGGATLGGTGSIGANVTVSSAGFLAPGASIESLDVTGNVILGGVLQVELSGAGAGSVDRLNVNGSLDITNASVDFSVLSALDDPAYVFASYTSLAGVQFATVTNRPVNYQLSYAFDGNQIALVLVDIPEPTGLALLGLGLLRLRRRR